MTQEKGGCNRELSTSSLIDIGKSKSVAGNIGEVIIKGIVPIRWASGKFTGRVHEKREKNQYIVLQNLSSNTGFEKRTERRKAR